MFNLGRWRTWSVGAGQPSVAEPVFRDSATLTRNTPRQVIPHASGSQMNDPYSFHPT